MSISGFIRRHSRTFAALAFLFAYSVGISFATPPVSPYQPGTTLQPSCLPGSTNCTTQILPSQTGNTGKLLTTDGSTTTWSLVPNTSLQNSTITINGSAIALGGSVSNLALTTNPLSQFAATTSAQLASVISDETGTGTLVYSVSPTFTGDITATTINGQTISSTASFTGSLTTAGYIQTTGEGQSLRLNNGVNTTQVGIKLTNGGGNSFIGLSNSAGTGYLSGTAYAFNIQTESARDLQLGTNNINRLVIDGTTGAFNFQGNSVTAGAITAAGLISYNGTAATNSPFLWATGTTTGSIYGTLVNTGGRMTWGVESSVGSGLGTGTAAYASVIGSTTGFATPLQFITNGVLRATIDSSGNISIPDLAGVGNRCVYADSTGQLNVKGFDCGSASGGDNLGDHTATQNIIMGTNWISGDGGNEGIRVDNSGNVGIGTAAPNYAGFGSYSGLLTIGGGTVPATTKGVLELASSAADASGNNVGYLAFIANANSSGNKQISAIQSDTTGSTAVNRGGVLAFLTKADGGALVERMRIDSAGSVGIGTTAPAYKLDVVTGAGGGSAYMRIQSTDASNQLILGAVGVGNRIYSRTNVGGAAPLYIDQGGTDVFMINSSGNVGIGLTAAHSQVTIGGFAAQTTAAITDAGTRGGAA